MKNKRTLVIPDVHNKVDIADYILEKEKDVDYTVFLGDYFDSFENDDVGKTARWLKDMIHRKDRKFVFLAGNHDLPYMFPANWNLYCSGFHPDKAKIINGILTRKEWSKLKLVHFEKRTIFSHAGISFELFRNQDGVILKNDVVDVCKEALICAERLEFVPYLSASASRGGRMPRGQAGITWLDWNENEPLDGWNQIIGHTCDYSPRVEEDSNGWYVACLDTNLNHYGVLEDSKELIIKRIMD